MNRKKRGFK